jgi:hypothetical protein
MAAAATTKSAGTVARPIVALVIVIACVVGCWAGHAAAQTVSPARAAAAVTPETGYIADDRYTNAFFGFLLPLPKDNLLGQSDAVLEHEKVLARVPLRHVLLLMQSQGSDGTVLAVIADECRDASMGDARKALPRSLPLEKVEMGGKQFWKDSYLEENVEGPLPFLPPSRSPWRSYRYATALSGYVLQINVFSPRTDILRKYVESIETLKFFDPAQAKALAGPFSRRYGTPPPRWDSETISGNIYSHAMLYFSYQLPADWHAGDKAAAEKAVNAARAAAQHWDSDRWKMEADEPCLYVVLALTKYPEGDRAKDFNPRLLVMALDPIWWFSDPFPPSEDRAAVEKTAADVAQVLQGAPFMGQDQRRVNIYSLNGRPMLEISSVTATDVPGRKEPVRLHTALILSPLRGYWLGVGLVSDTPADLEMLRKLDVTFPAQVP